MKIQSIAYHSYRISLVSQLRSGILVYITDTEGNSGWGDVAPLPKFSKESVEDALQQLNLKKQEILQNEWNAHNCLEGLTRLQLYPSVLFGLESALLSILSPLPAYTVPASALLMGTAHEILQQAKQRHEEGFTSAKLKVSNLGFEEAYRLIHQLKDKFRLRIDVNRAWSTKESLRFFSQFPLDTFDYVEEPFKNPDDLALFPHPLAVDESFPENLSLAQLESLPTLKALIYKPTIQGGLLGCIPLHDWAKKKGVSLVLSSSFESDIGLAHVASIAQRLSLPSPVGIGTYHFLKECLCADPLQFSNAIAHIPSRLTPKDKALNKLATLNTYDASAIQYTKNTELLHPTEHAQKFINMLPSPAKIIDIGCGPGRDAKVFSDLGLEVVGVDFSSKMIEIASQTAPKATFHVMDIESLDFPKETFDGAWANCALLHIPKKNIPLVLVKICSILKQKGVLYLSVKEGSAEILEQDDRYNGLEKFWSYFQEDELKILLKNAGFNLLDMCILNKTIDYHTHPLIIVFAQKALL